MSRLIPDDVLALLQKRSMIGADKPTHEVYVEGMPDTRFLQDPSNFTDWRTYISKGYGNVCETSDGKAIAAYVEGDAVKVAFAPTIRGIMDGTESFDTASALTIYTAPESSLMQVSVSLIDGKLHISISNELPLPVKAYYYNDSDGRGIDFSFVSNITLDNGDYWNSSYDRGIVNSTIHKLGNGNYVCAVPDRTRIGGNNVRAFYSANEGAAWTAGERSGLSGSAHVNSASSKILTPIGDDKFFCYQLSSNDSSKIFYWTNSGANYSLQTIDYSAWSAAVIIVGEKAYMVRTQGSSPFPVIFYQLKSSFAIDDIDSYRVLANFDVVNTLNPGLGTRNLGLILGANELIAFETRSNLVAGAGTDVVEGDKLTAKAISISRNKGMASGLTISFDNKGGKYSPDKDEFNKVLWPGNQIEIKQGYGSNLIETFTGLNDRISIKAFPYEIVVSARDMMKKALDQTITTSLDGHVLHFDDELIEDIFTTLCGLGNITYGTVQETTIRLTHTFTWETYADAFRLLEDIAYFNVTADEYGVVHFMEFSTRQPEHEQSVTLDDDGGTQPFYELEKTPGVLRSERVYDSTETTLYTRDTDYEVEYSPMRIKRIDAAGINDGDTVVVKYVYPKHVFREGVDLVRTQMDISDEGLYAKVIVHGQDDDGNVLEAEEEFTSASFFGVSPQKILPIDLGRDGNTLAKCENVAERAIANIATKSRVISFTAVAVPWLTSGDRIQIVEVSMFGPEYTEPIFGDILDGMGLVYTITDLSFSQSDNGYTMSGEAYFSGYAPQPEV